MSYNTYGVNIIPYFNVNTNRHGHETTVPNATTNYKIGGTDISSSYLGIGSSSNIPVSRLLPTTNYKIGGIDISTLYELNLVNYDGSDTPDFYSTLHPPADHSGFLLQFRRGNGPISFNYKVDLSFVIIGGGGGGGSVNESNAGGGGGAGELIIGSMIGIPAGTDLAFARGDGGASDTAGSDTTLTCNGKTITAKGGGEGGAGKDSSSTRSGSSTGGGGSWSNADSDPGIATSSTINDTGYFKNMTSFNNSGGEGMGISNDTGAGGGGGGAGGVGETASSTVGGGNGGKGKTITFGSTSFNVAGGGGGGAKENSTTSANAGGTNSYGGGTGGGRNSNHKGVDGTEYTGGGGGGAGNSGDEGTNGGAGGHGTVILYIIPSGVSV